MSTKRYFWIKLMSDFFDKTEIRLIEKAPHGKEIVLLYLKLLCMSIDSAGYLLFNGKAYNVEIIAMITDTEIEIVKAAISLFEQYGLIERREDAFYMPQIESMMASETYWAEVKRKQRERQTVAEIGHCPKESTPCPTNVPLLREDIEKDIDTEKKKKKEETTLQIFERILPNYDLSDILTNKLREWFKYKAERKEAYKETGMKSLLTQINKQSNAHGDIVICDLIDECMANGWKGIIWDKLTPKPPTSSERLLNRVNSVDDW